jgi:hypothetical protein
MISLEGWQGDVTHEGWLRLSSALETWRLADQSRARRPAWVSAMNTFARTRMRIGKRASTVVRQVAFSITFVAISCSYVTMMWRIDQQEIESAAVQLLRDHNEEVINAYIYKTNVNHITEFLFNTGERKGFVDLLKHASIVLFAENSDWARRLEALNYKRGRNERAWHPDLKLNLFCDKLGDIAA